MVMFEVNIRCVSALNLSEREGKVETYQDVRPTLQQWHVAGRTCVVVGGFVGFAWFWFVGCFSRFDI